MLLFNSAPHTQQCHMSNLTPRTMRAFGLCRNDDFDAPTRVLFVLPSRQYESLAAMRQHLYLDIQHITVLSDSYLSSRHLATTTLRHSRSRHDTCLPLSLTTMSAFQPLDTAHVRSYCYRRCRRISAHPPRGHPFMQSLRLRHISVCLTTIPLRAIAINTFRLLLHTQRPMPSARF